MKKTYTLLAVAALALSLFSCQKDPAYVGQPSPETALTPQQKLDRLSPPLVLFQYAFVNLETGQESGWIIDRSGNVRPYEYARDANDVPASGNEAWEEGDLANLYALATEPAAAIEIEELLKRAHQGLALSSRFLSGTETDEAASWVAGFYAFTQTTSAGNDRPHSNCYGATTYNNNIPTTTRINRKIVNLSGHINRYETSNYATDLHQWLLNLEEGLE
ncbi:MAG: hypothetical protein J5I98_20940 [Phaeodactylibacter sp.]|nr:hypothetical protein [Phaeodactylibacter sp.]